MSEAGGGGEGRKKRRKLPETVTGFPDVPAHELKEEPNPFNDPDWRMLGYAWTGFTLRIVLVLAAIFSVYQYMQAREEQRIERTLQLVELWERPEYQDAQRALKQRLSALNEKHAGLLGKSPSQAEIAIYYDRIGLEAMKPEGGAMPVEDFREAFDRLVYFLNRLSFCVEGNLCSQAVADAYFLDFAKSFWGYFGGFVAEQRKRGAPNFASAIEDYVTAER